MLQLNATRKVETPQELPKRWKYRKKYFPNGKGSLWAGFKCYPLDEKFFCRPKTMIIKFDKELDYLGNENITALNEWRVTKLSYSSYLPKMCEELNFFEAIYDKEGELISSLFRIKYLIDVDNVSYTMKNFDAFKDLCYNTIFTESLKAKIVQMVEENYIDDIEEDNTKAENNPDLLSIMQRKKKSLEFLNDHVKAILEVAFCIKILSFVINHFAVMRSINIQKNSDIFSRFYMDAFYIFDWGFDVYNKIYA